MRLNEEKYKEARRLQCRYLAELAKEKGLTQSQIAEKTGFTQNNVSRMLSGTYSPSLDNFMRLCEAIGVYIFIIDKDHPDDDLVETMKNRWGFNSEN